jgi:glycine reductase
VHLRISGVKPVDKSRSAVGHVQVCWILFYLNKKRKEQYQMLKGKKVAILGDRDGIPGPAIEECIKAAGAEVVFSTTECFV